MSATPPRFDAFLSYSRRDAREVEALAGRLAGEAGLAVWMDRARLQPGASWRGEIEEAMNRSEAAVVVWGPGGLGPVQRQERDLAYALRDGRPGFRVLYVFLPGTPPPQGTWANVDTWIRFEGGLDEADPFARLVAAVKGEAPSADLAAGLPDEPAPYRGLAAFDVDDRRFFFGRSAEIAEMQERLAHHPFLAVLGASGSGKTSLVQAGLLARLPAAGWEELVVRPGPRPLHALAGALARFRPGGPLAAADDLLRRLGDAPGDLPTLLDLLLPAGRRLALVVDRLEELFTLAESDEKTEQEKLIAAVLALATAPEGRARVVATMRADFYGRLGRYPDLAGQVVDHQLYIKDLDQGAVAEVIEAPAAQVGAIFEKGLAARVRDDASQGGEVVLPLLQHALDLLWRKRRGRWLTWDAYQEIGGVQGALRYHADRAVEALGAGEREVARGLLTRLVWIDEETAAATAGRRLDKSSLVGDDGGVERVLQRLADERLVVLRGATVELVHDTLPLHWEQLRSWVREDREFLLWRQRLRADLAEWQRTGGDEGTLLRGAPLVEAERWLGERRKDLGPEEAELIAASTALRERERKARERLRRRTVGSLAAGLALSLGLSLLAFLQWRAAERQRRVSLSRQLAAQGMTELPQRLDLALLLGVEAQRTADTSEARGLLATGLEHGRRILAFLHAPTGIHAVGVDPTGKVLGAGLEGGSVQRWDLATRRPLGAPLTGGAETPIDLVLGPGGKTLVEVGWQLEGKPSDLLRTGKMQLHAWDLARPAKVHLTEGLDEIAEVAFSPSQRIMALLGRNAIAFWDLAALRPIGRPVAFRGWEVKGIEFGSETALVVRRDDEASVLWRIALPQPAAEPLLDGEILTSAAFSPTGHRLALGTARSLQLWDLAARRRVGAVASDLPSPIMGLGFRAGGAELVSVAQDGAITLWDPQELGVGRPAGSVESPVTAVTFSPTGRTLLAHTVRGDTEWSRIQLWHPELIPDHPPRFLPLPTRRALFSPDGSQLAVFGYGDLALWRPDNELTEELRVHSASVRDAVFSHDGSFLAAGDRAGKVILWSLREPRSFGRRLPKAGGSAVGLSPDGTQLAWVANNEIAIWDLVADRPLPPLVGHKGQVTAVTFSPDGRTLAAADWNVQWGGKDFDYFGVLHLWDVASQKAVRSAMRTGYFRGLAFSPDGQYLVAHALTGQVVFFDLARERRNGPFAESALMEQATGLAVHPRQNLVALATGEKTIPVVDLETRSSVGPQLTAPRPVVSVAWSSGGETLAAGLDDGKLVLWDLASGKMKGDALGGSSPARRLAFSPDGDLLAAFQANGALALWDIALGRTLFPPVAGNPTEVAAVSFHPQRPMLVSSGEGNPLILWDLDTRTWVRRACEIANRNLTEQEWRQYVGKEVPYRKTCPELPGPEEPAAETATGNSSPG